MTVQAGWESRWQLSDLGNAERLVDRHGDYLRHVPGLGWIAWNGRHWERDTTGAVMRAMKQTVRAMKHEAADAIDHKAGEKLWQHAHHSESRPRLEAAIALAASEAEILVSVDDLDRDPYLLCVENGTIDLRTGVLREHRPADLITRGSTIAWDPDAGCPRWARFLLEVFGGDTELAQWFQYLVGYCLTGETNEHVLAVFHGAGCNGKSTTIHILERLLGDLATTAAFDTFARSRGDRGPRNDLARLRGARLVTASESGEGRRLDEAVVKEITGGDRIAARFLYGEHFEYRPAFKLILITNHKPRVDADDDAIWRRLRLVPFTQSFEGREDHTLTATLEGELPGILRWAVAGAVKWTRIGLDSPAAVLQATAEYRDDEDTIGAFLAERCILGEDQRVPKARLRAAYDRWCEDNGERALGAAELGARLARHGIRRGGAGRSQYIGVRVTANTPGSAGDDAPVGNLPYAHTRGEKTESDGTGRHPVTTGQVAA